MSRLTGRLPPYQETGEGGIEEKTIVAAFSPGARVKDGSKILAKMCGDGRHQLFFWRPFTWNEAQVLISKLGYTIAASTQTIGLQFPTSNEHCY